MKFILYKNGQYFAFKLIEEDQDGYLLQSQSYTTKQAALNGIDSVVTNGPNSGNYSDESSNGYIWFDLHSTNGQVIGTSEHFPDTPAGKDKKKKKKETTVKIPGLPLIEDIT